MKIERVEAGKLRKIGKWVLVFGRRKTGKTYLVKNFSEYDEYFFVKRDKTVFSENSGREISFSAFEEVFRRLLAEGKTVVVDEFHRLGEGFLDLLHFIDKKGKLVLVSSTLHLAKKIFGKNSPLLGLFAEFPVGLISLGDVAKMLGGVKDKKERAELAMLLREPLVIDYYAQGMPAKTLFSTAIAGSRFTVPALVGEIFTEEDRSLSAVYEGILRAIASGRQVSTEISSFLFSRKLVPKDDPSIIQQYLGNLAGFGLIKRVKILNKNTFIYLHVSPLVEAFYYGDEKYNLSEATADERLVSTVFEELFPRIAEAQVREFLAQLFGLSEAVIKERDFDVDGVLLKFKKPEIAIEVKWKKKVDYADVQKAVETLSKTTAKRRLLFVPDKNTVRANPEGIEVVDISDFV